VVVPAGLAVGARVVAGEEVAGLPCAIRTVTAPLDAAETVAEDQHTRYRLIPSRFRVVVGPARVLYPRHSATVSEA
jgi:hypothetical protein